MREELAAKGQLHGRLRLRAQARRHLALDLGVLARFALALLAFQALLALLAVADHVARLAALETLVVFRRRRLHGPGRKRGTEAVLRGSDATKGAATDAAGSHELTEGSKSLLLLLLLVRSLRMLEELAGDAS